MSLLSIKSLNKIYDNGTQALTDINLDVQPGEFLVVIGLSGSGKSTLLRCLNRLVDPTSGEIYFQNKRIDKSKGNETRTLRKKLAMIFQHFNLIGRHSALSNVLMGRLATTPTWKSLLHIFSKEDQKLALEYLDLVGLKNKAENRVDELSGGQQQRVAIARALAQKPQLILADEPVASLDPATCYTVMNYLRKVNQELGLTIICNIHFLSLAREFGTRAIALKDGRIVFDGSPKDITPARFKEIYGEEAHEVQIG